MSGGWTHVGIAGTRMLDLDKRSVRSRQKSEKRNSRDWREDRGDAAYPYDEPFGMLWECRVSYGGNQSLRSYR